MGSLFTILLLLVSCADKVSAQDIGQSARDSLCTITSTTTNNIEAAFGPEDGAEAVILKSIACAKASIHVAAFAFSSPVIVEALLAAKQRGVNIQIVADHKHNIEEDEKGISRRAFDALTGAGIPVRTNSNYRIHHDKFIVVDARHVQTGSYNYTSSANKNSENVLVAWNNPKLAARYLAHWESRFRAGVIYLKK